MIADGSPADAVAIVGQSLDEHVAIVREKVETLGVRCLMLDEERVGFRLTYVDSAVIVEAQVDGTWVPLNTMRAVWWWRKETTLVHSRSDDFTTDFALREHRELLESLELLIPTAVWPIRPSAVRTASLKAYQLALAQQLGFAIPTTIITNDADSVARFVEAKPDTFPEQLLLYKPLTWYVGPPDKFLYANIVTLDDVTSSPSSVAAAPCQFQEYVDKDYELRVTVVGNRCFPVRINSQSQPESMVDFRRGQELVSYELWEVSADLTARLLLFLHRCGLDYGAFDLIVKPDGCVVFLELNPVGQWLWLEYKLGIDISGVVARMLVDGSTSG
ncbi:MAG TPA: hypothetical protein VFT01_04070 [Homoserinimonas sp.]|nr:hypothetical protein [Homoserinimonas sp.]